jgi:hypothetical protein
MVQGKGKGFRGTIGPRRGRRQCMNRAF